jgi:riboflavin kinase/FMN adenylyltransferase
MLEEMPGSLKGSVMLLGNFDGFHCGHRALLDAARARARALGRPLGIMSVEPHPRELFASDAGPFRLTTRRTKYESFERMGFDLVFQPKFDRAFAGQHAEDFVARVLVDGLGVSHVVVGFDFRFGRGREGDIALLERVGAELCFGVSEIAPTYCRGAVCSSSLVRDLVRSGDLRGVSALLGNPWTVEVTAIRTDLTPNDTTYVLWPKEILRPPHGCYAARLRRFGSRVPLATGELILSPDEDPRIVAGVDLWSRASEKFSATFALDLLS